jgi:hypothetical protein
MPETIVEHMGIEIGDMDQTMAYQGGKGVPVAWRAASMRPTKMAEI